MDVYSCLKTVAFQCDPEKAHELFLSSLSSFGSLIKPLFPNKFSEKDIVRLTLELGPLSFKGPIGLAPGLDKNAVAIDFFTSLLFGHVEVGTVTLRPQEGNPRPRLFRLKEEESLRNCMGFNNLGSAKVLRHIQASHLNGKTLGVNLGKNKTTPENEAYKDYRALYQLFSGVAHFLTINVSSPNTPGLRGLQERGPLKEILDALDEERKSSPRPLFIKLSPDLAPESFGPIIKLAQEKNLAGLIATNTTIMSELGKGGVSGKLLKEKAKNVRNLLLKELDGTGLELIGVGGIDSFPDVWDFWMNGGKICQVYSAFIYQGPSLINRIYGDTLKVLNKLGFDSLPELLSEREKLKKENLNDLLQG